MIQQLHCWLFTSEKGKLMLIKSLCTSVHSSTIHHCPKNGMKASNKQANKYIYNCLKIYVHKRNEQYTETTSLRTEYLKCREV